MYSLDGGLTNYTITELNGTIDQSVWDSLSQGDVTLTFYAIDAFGRLGSEDVNITLRIPSGGRIGLNFFFSYFLILMISGMIVIRIITGKRFKGRIKPN